MKTADSRKGFEEFCDIVRNVEKDKDKFLDAAHLDRHERQTPALAPMHLVCIIAVAALLVLCSVAILCLTMAGKTGGIPIVFGGAAVIILLIAFAAAI